jgi:hypothetical protein
MTAQTSCPLFVLVGLVVPAHESRFLGPGVPQMQLEASTREKATLYETAARLHLVRIIAKKSRHFSTGQAAKNSKRAELARKAFTGTRVRWMKPNWRKSMW